MRPLSSVLAESTTGRRILRRFRRAHLRRLPDRLAIPLVAARSYARPRVADEFRFAGPGPLRTTAYWLTVGEDEGPACSVYYGEEEVLRFDGLRDNPHVHYGLSNRNGNEGGETRLRLAPSTTDEIIDRLAHDLRCNLGFCLGDHRRRVVRRLHIDDDEAAAVAEAVHDHLRRLVDARRSARRD